MFKFFSIQYSIFVFLFIVIIQTGCTPSSEALAQSAADWEHVRQLDRAQVPKGWPKPQHIGTLSTPGWEDGAYISPDGNTLYFIYTDIDVFRFPLIKRTGPDRDPEGVCFLGCGTFPRADLFVAKRTDTGWGPAQIHPLTIERPVGGFVLQSPDKAYFMYGPDESQGKEDIAWAEKRHGKWSKPQLIREVSSEYTDRDPWISPDDKELWFTSERPASMGGENIYISKRSGWRWGEPELAPEPLNSDKDEMQPFLHGDYVYFASTRDGPLAIYRSKRDGDDFSKPEKIIWSKYGVGEPSLSADGSILSFVQVFKDGLSFNIDLMEIRFDQP